MTFDIEDWYHLLQHEETANEGQWSRCEPRIERNTQRILECLDEAHVKATFFCLGWVARNHPLIIKAIHAAGHEIGSHSDKHQLVNQQTQTQFREDLLRSIRSLEDLTGQKIRAYRAPGFSITRHSIWAFSVLAENGIEWDSSIFAARHSHGGLPTFASNVPTIIEHESVRIKEFPVVPGRLLLGQISFSGGGYFRILPYPVVQRLMRRSDYVKAYFHPRNFDPDQPLVPRLSPQRILKSYAGLRSSLRKFKALLKEFSFVSIGQQDDRLGKSTDVRAESTRPPIT
ncbi:polysaccharide deacetylase family protein [uncultured Bradyrhizobium sp.]|jgi:polysaccharide deacetylase family protein (PEP-CTERM system associated)|uniref:polysaccharide deacetylase family protein n=1 Tax=uncultured Bradyrhizobium sp. TaxID=199684 RepID=UPI0026200972|nr:polysaccharide deacetylase family protein [uncultured Bradyrhizobium sp.]